jgi:MoaA/NifB/PqqE/SkfB family radical SAM enzyme
LWKEHLEACITGNFLSPVTSDIDMSSRCPANCAHCNAWRIRDNKAKDLPTEHWLRISDFLREWGVKSSCIAGGGESMVHKGFLDLLQRHKKNKLESGVITTGIPMGDKHINIIAETCRWIGFSMDASTAETWAELKNLKNKELFSRICTYIKKLCLRIEQTNSYCDVAYKFLIQPKNAHEIYSSAKLAKELGVKDFHARPVGFDNIKPLKGLTNEIFKNNDLIKLINDEIEKAMELEDENFHVYGVRHKFNPDFTKKVNFKKCRLLPMIPTFGADGNVHLCFDRRGDKDLILCSHYPDPEEILRIWGTDFHKDMMNKIDPVNDCPRCTWGKYHEMLENIIISDKMCKNFP